jgi:hypothetical protein
MPQINGQEVGPIGYGLMGMLHSKHAYLQNQPY